jgi:hypothetical protein
MTENVMCRSLVEQTEGGGGIKGIEPPKVFSPGCRRSCLSLPE